MLSDRPLVDPSGWRPDRADPSLRFGPGGHAAHPDAPGTGWGGPNCPPAAELRALVDDYLSTPNPAFPGLGSTVPGLSTSWSSKGCGTFTYAAGLREVEDGRPMTPATLMGIASMTKPVIAALALKLDEKKVFGRTGLDTPVSRLLSARDIAQLTVGGDPTHPRCPGRAPLMNRQTRAFEQTHFSCPDLSKVTLRHLMTANHGMYDYFNEVRLPSGSSQYEDGVYFALFKSLGAHPVPPVSSTRGFDYLKAFGLKRDDSAVIGGNRRQDFEDSLGNTGFQLLGVILERRTGRSLDRLIRELITAPLHVDEMFVYVDSAAKRRHLIADGYDIVTDDPLFEDTGVYPLADFRGHSALNTLSLGRGRPANINTAGGAGGLVANMRSYRAFLEAFVEGKLLGPAARAELARSFVVIPDISAPPSYLFANGFGLYRETVRGFPGIPDFNAFAHRGSLPGISCEDSVLRPEDNRIPPVTGVVCINARNSAYPDPFALVSAIAQLIFAARAS